MSNTKPWVDGAKISMIVDAEIGITHWSDMKADRVAKTILEAAAQHYEPLLEAKDKLLAYNDGEFQRLHAQLTAKEKEVEELRQVLEAYKNGAKMDADVQEASDTILQNLWAENATLKAEVERLKGENERFKNPLNYKS